VKGRPAKRLPEERRLFYAIERKLPDMRQMDADRPARTRLLIPLLNPVSARQRPGLCQRFMLLRFMHLPYPARLVCGRTGRVTAA